MRLRRLLWGVCLALPGMASAAELVPLFKLDLLGGQFFFEDQNTSFSGNANWLMSPGVKFSDKDVLVPTVSGQYRRTREVRELIGGGFLTQESLDNSALLKLIHSLNEAWSVKPNIGFKNELIAETKGEVLGKGLFDYNKLSFGLEAERKGERLKSLRQSVSAYGVRYYHYQALSSQGEQLGAEINSGNKVLDFNAYDYSIAADYLPADGTLLTAMGLVSFRPFVDQRIVKVTGQFEGDNRKDMYYVGQLGAQQQIPSWSLRSLSAENVGGLNVSYTLLNSNQNDYDAGKTRFNPDYYDYGEVAVGPFYALRLNKKLGMTLAYDYTHRDYRRRPARTSNGDYTSNIIFLDDHTISCYLTYPIYDRISFKLQGAYRSSSSNMQFEKVYRYNYRSANYFVGFGYAL